MKKNFLMVLLVSVSLAACGRTPAPLGADAPADKVPNIIGEYAINGFDPLGEEYGGRLTITAGGNPNEYKMQWLVTGGVHAGIGVLDGNQLTVTWKTLTGPIENISGSGIYTITINGELYGTRAVDGVENPGTETAYPNPK